MSCAWYFVGTLSLNGWVKSQGLLGHRIPVVQKYVASFYWAYSTVCKPPGPTTWPLGDGQNLFSMPCW